MHTGHGIPPPLAVLQMSLRPNIEGVSLPAIAGKAPVGRRVRGFRDRSDAKGGGTERLAVAQRRLHQLQLFAG